MKVYVDELPKSCKQCPFNRMTFFWTSNVFEKCKATNECQLGFNGKCELQSLADYTKQVRKELIDKLALFLIGTFSKDAEFSVEEILNWFQEVKHQIQGENK